MKTLISQTPLRVWLRGVGDGGEATESHWWNGGGKVCMASLYRLDSWGLFPYLHIPDGSPPISGCCCWLPTLTVCFKPTASSEAAGSLIGTERREGGWWGSLPVVTNSHILLQMGKPPKTLHTCLFSNVACRNCLWLHADHSVLLNRAGNISCAVPGPPA